MILAGCSDGGRPSPEPEIIFTTSGPPPPSPTSKGFRDVTDASGIAFTVGYLSAMSNPEVPQIRGDRAANLLYRNDGNLVFTNVAEAAGVAHTRSNNRVWRHSSPAFADLDGDADLDLLIPGLDGDPTLLLANQGDGTFVDQTAGSGFDTMTARFTLSTALGDYDRDGDLDVLFGHWGTPRNLVAGPGDTEHLWRNESSAGQLRFRSVSSEAGISPSIMTNDDPLITQRAFDNTFTPTFANINDDPWPDILIAGDFNFSQYFMNLQDGTFLNATDFNVIIDGNGMGSAVGDYDGDGDVDWFVSSIMAVGDESMPAHLSRIGNRLYRNDDGMFYDATDEAEVASGGWGWGSCFMDFNNDGNLDLYQTNGWLDFAEYGDFDADATRAFLSDGDGTFVESAEALGLDDTEQGRGVVCADLDKDGDADILQLHMGGLNAATLWMNESDNNFLTVTLRGKPPNTQAIGARIVAGVGGRDRLRAVNLGSNFASHNPPVQIFGLGTSSQVDTLTVYWPDGRKTLMRAIGANQHLVVEHPALIPAP
ncbi:MAG: CRTAC1 family protein [Pseudomonadota bacterium]